jgi:hypothetical protein
MPDSAAVAATAAAAAAASRSAMLKEYRPRALTTVAAFQSRLLSSKPSKRQLFGELQRLRLVISLTSVSDRISQKGKTSKTWQWQSQSDDEVDEDEQVGAGALDDSQK